MTSTTSTAEGLDTLAQTLSREPLPEKERSTQEQEREFKSETGARHHQQQQEERQQQQREQHSHSPQEMMYNPIALLKRSNSSSNNSSSGVGTSNTSTPSPHACPTCGDEGFGLRIAGRSAENEYLKRIAELEAQVKILSDKATAAADKLADYEDEIQRLKRASPTKAMVNPPPQQISTPPPSTALSPSGRISNFLSITTRRGAGPPSPPIDPSESRPSSAGNAPPVTELEKALTTEKSLRQQAEVKLQDVTNELEELSASLFQQANEMVADERRARSKLEARIVVLEKRDQEKVERLGRLEGAMERIERVKGLLVSSPISPGSVAAVGKGVRSP